MAKSKESRVCTKCGVCDKRPVYKHGKQWLHMDCMRGEALPTGLSTLPALMGTRSSDYKGLLVPVKVIIDDPEDRELMRRSFPDFARVVSGRMSSTTNTNPLAPSKNH